MNFHKKRFERKERKKEKSILSSLAFLSPVRINSLRENTSNFHSLSHLFSINTSSLKLQNIIIFLLLLKNFQTLQIFYNFFSLHFKTLKETGNSMILGAYTSHSHSIQLPSHEFIATQVYRTKPDLFSLPCNSRLVSST